MESDWKMVRAFGGQYTFRHIPALKDGLEEAMNDTEKARLLGQTFNHVCSNSNYGDNFMRRRQYFEDHTYKSLPIDDEFDSPINKEFALRKLKRAIWRKESKAPGCDGINYEMLKHLDNSALQKLLNIANKSWIIGEVPKHGSIQ